MIRVVGCTKTRGSGAHTASNPAAHSVIPESTFLRPPVTAPPRYHPSAPVSPPASREALNQTTFFILSWVVLAALLFLPVSRLMWVMSVRRLERRQKRRLEEAEREAQLRRARAIAVIVVLAFSFLFNLHMVGLPGG